MELLSGSFVEFIHTFPAEDRKKILIHFDYDGTIMPHGVEPGEEEFEKYVNKFVQVLHRLHKFGIQHVGINTRRSEEQALVENVRIFIYRVQEKSGPIFPNGISLDFMTPLQHDSVHKIGEIKIKKLLDSMFSMSTHDCTIGILLDDTPEVIDQAIDYIYHPKQQQKQKLAGKTIGLVWTNEYNQQKKQKQQKQQQQQYQSEKSLPVYTKLFTPQHFPLHHQQKQQKQQKQKQDEYLFPFIISNISNISNISHISKRPTKKGKTRPTMGGGAMGGGAMGGGGKNLFGHDQDSQQQKEVRTGGKSLFDKQQDY